MKLEVNLDAGWVSEYEETISELIKQEISSVIRESVRKAIKDVVDDHMNSVRKALADEIRKITPKKLNELLVFVGKEQL